MRAFALTLALFSAIGATDYDPIRQFIYALHGCKTDCAAEEQGFADSGVIYLSVSGSDGKHELLLHRDGTIEVDAPSLSFVARRGVTATLPRRESAAIFAAFDQLRDRLTTDHKRWLDYPSALDTATVTLAFGLQGKIHFVQKAAIYLQHDYTPLLVALLPYLDADALLARARTVHLKVDVAPAQMYSRIGPDPVDEWPAEKVLPASRVDGAALSQSEWSHVADALHEAAKRPWADPRMFGKREGLRARLLVHASDLEERVVTTQETIDRAKTSLYGWRVAEETPDRLTLQLDVFYDGSHGDEALTCVSAFDNDHASHTGCVPSAVRKGRSVTTARIQSASTAPEMFDTTTLEIPFYEVGTGHVFQTVRLPLWKRWKRVNQAPR